MHHRPPTPVLSLVIVKQGESEIPGLTDTIFPKRLGPKRATKIRKFFNLKHQKEQKAEFDADIAKRVAEKKAKAAAVKVSHKATTA
ncbi:hypothetical protein NP233_g9417 [Leucocoprinus birnbaumii]|uniref:Uncharacterized protein n=1 Tax=Leucocoprinus birnbaumii TaxID=56174 RepID=A0AAD5YM87_9AGAR|nr:hypothetical protein NP233_g9417 [Leucocoprinus birnbaumii]